MESLCRIHFTAIVLGSTSAVLLDMTVHFNTVENTPFPINPATRIRINEDADREDTADVSVAVVVILVDGWINKSIVSPMAAL